MRKVYGYSRVSLEKQVDGVSLDAQKGRIEAWSVANGLQVQQVFTDAGISGKRADNRPALQQALEAVIKDKGILVVYSLSRLARSTKDAIGISERLEKAGADLVSLSEKLDTSTASGKMTFRMMAVLAEFERDQLAERVSSALKHKLMNGQRAGNVAYGFDLQTDGDTLKQSPAEQATIQTMQALRQAGKSYWSIAADLTKKNVPTKRGGRWSAGGVMRILNNQTLKVAA
jgi:site-specific DNA recombinase